MARKTASATDVEKARGLAAQLRAMKAAGVSPSKIGRAYDIPVGAVDTVLLEEPPAAATAVPGRATQPAAEIDRPETYGGHPWTGPQTPWQSTGSSPLPSSPPPIEPSWVATTSEPTIPPAEPLRAPPSPPAGYEAPGAGLSDALRKILYYSGIRPATAEGVILAYGSTRMEDLGELADILARAGVAPRARDFAIDLWSRQISPIDSEARPLLRTAFRGSTDPVAEARRQAVEAEKLELEQLSLKIQRARLENDLRSLAPPGPTPPPPAPGPDPVTSQKLGALEARNRELEAQLQQQTLRQVVAAEVAASESRILARIPSAPPALTRESAEAAGTQALTAALAAKVTEPSAMRTLARGIADSPEVTRAVIGKLSLLGGEPELAGGVPEATSEADLAKLAAAMEAKASPGARPRSIDKIAPAPPVRDDYPGG